ncbi:MAG: AsmA family protein [Gammaproteobacteria bacterium]|nr:AsmA family protein [Gammaproteobacteria bacterium]
MTRTLKITLGAIGALVLLVAVIAWLVLDNLDRLVTDAIESNGSAATGTSVNVDGLHIALRAAEGDIAGLSIDNPPGFEAEHAIRFESIHLTLDPATLLEQTVHVRELRVDAAQVNLEQQGRAKSNLQILIDNVNAYSEPAGEPDEASKNIVIDEFILEQAELTVRSELLGDAELTLPRIRATDVGSESAGATAADALEEVLRPILAEALDQAGNRAVEAGRERIEEEVGERLQDLIKDQAGE